MSALPEMKPCPFCGAPAMVEECRDGRFSVGCTEPDGECMGYISLNTFDRKTDAIHAWNKRAPLQQDL